MEPSIHTFIQGLDETQIYLFNVEDGRWVTRAVTIDIARLHDRGAAWTGFRGVDPGPHPLAITGFGPFGPDLAVHARQEIEAACHAGDLNQRLETGNRDLPSRYPEPIRERAAGLYAVLLSASMRYGVTEAHWRMVQPLAPLTVALAVAVAENPVRRPEAGEPQYDD